MTAEDRLRNASAPDEAGAEERARRVVLEAAPVAAPRRRLRVAAVLAAVIALAGAFTPPGEAVADWMADLVAPEAAPPPPQPVLGSLPAPGRLLVSGRDGAWIVGPDGSRERLGDYEDVTWSPQGLFVAATRGRSLLAVEPAGAVRWGHTADATVADPAWSPSGYRVAYRSGDDLRVIAGDGSGDRLVAEGVADVPAAWRPVGSPHEVAVATANGAVELWDADDPEPGPARRPVAGPVVALGWASADRLVVVLRHSVELLDARLRLVRRVGLTAPPPGARALTAAAISPDGRTVALARGARVESAGLTRAPHRRGGIRLDAGGPVSGLAFSPDGSRLLIASDAADQWYFVPVRTGRTTAAVVRGYPRLGGWCCARDALGTPPTFAGAPFTRVSPPSRRSCVEARTTVASTVPLRDPPRRFPPRRTLASMGPGDALVVLSAWRDTCAGEPAIPPAGAPPPELAAAAARREHYPGVRGARMHRGFVRAPGGYWIDLKIFTKDGSGLSHADALLRGLTLPARLG